MGEGNAFSLFTGGRGYSPSQGIYPPAQVRTGGGKEGYPKVPTPPQSRSGWRRGYSKVPTPHPGQDGGIPRYLTPPHQGICPPPPAWSGQDGGGGEGYPKVPTPPLATVPIPCPGQDKGGGTPRYLTPPPPSQVRMGVEGVPQGPYPYPGQDGGGRCTPRYLHTPPPAG